MFNHQSSDVDDLISKLTSHASASPSLSRRPGCPAPRPSAPATLLSRTHAHHLGGGGACSKAAWIPAPPARRPRQSAPCAAAAAVSWLAAVPAAQPHGAPPGPAGRDWPLSSRTTAFGKEAEACSPGRRRGSPRLDLVVLCSSPHRRKVGQRKVTDSRTGQHRDRGVRIHESSRGGSDGQDNTQTERSIHESSRSLHLTSDAPQKLTDKKTNSQATVN